MANLFDEFMKELRRRQAAAEGRPAPDDDAGDDEDAPDDAPRADDDETEPARDADPTDDAEARPRPMRRRAGPSRGGPRGGGPGRPGRPARGGANDGGRSLRRSLTISVAIILAVFLVLMFVVGIQLWTDAIWYRSVGFDAVFWTRLGSQVALFVAGGLIAAVILLGNLWLAGRLAPASGADGGRGGTMRSWIDRLNEAAANAEQRRGSGGPFDQWQGRRPGGDAANVTPVELPDLVPLGRTAIAVVVVLIALGVAGSTAAHWDTILLWQNRVPFDPSGTPVPDPVFGRDISFYLFDLPFLRFLQAEVIGILVAALAVVGGRYLLAAVAGNAVFDTRVRVHLGILAGLFLMTIAAGYQLDKFELVYSNRGIATGVSFTDADAQFLAYNVLTGLSAIAAAFIVGGAFARVLWPLWLTLAVWFIASIGIGRIYPEIVQRLTVGPNQLAQEQPYIANNIAMTRLAFDLNGWDVHDYVGQTPLSEAAIDEHEATFLNARLWDYRPLGDTLGQIQTVRQYYDFTDVDTDRYTFGDTTRQVMLSVRELALEKNANATGWVNQRIIYTHGIGVAMVPVNEVASQGLPHLVIQNLPPVSIDGAPKITEPRVYFGERDSSYVVVGAQQAEFDYPRGQATGGAEDVVKTTWTGSTGIRLDTTLSRLLFALRFRDLDLLISNQVTAQSQLLFHRSISDRLPLVAPFLRYDKDPYIVIDGAGRLVYIQDAYTVTDRFPHAQAFDPAAEFGQTTGLGSDPINYIRNSVKIVTDAYDGTMTFYVNAPQDPLIRAWEGVFPTLFKPMSAFPEDLRPHLRVPEEMFNVQTRTYGRYHVQNPETFYSQEDLWTPAVGATSEQSLPGEAYYVIMSLPEAVNPEFLLLQPMIPKGRPNMIAWLAARNDAPNYGETRVYRFPPDTSVFGPAQIEAQIDSDPIISAQFTLWGQSGSKIIRGNLIVVPVGDSLVYLQPVYLQATSAKFPAFQKIIVASPTKVVWGDTLRQALNQLLVAQGGGPGPSPTPAPTPRPSATPGPSGSPGPGPTPPAANVAALVEYANQHFELAQQALRDEDLARYAAELQLVRQALAQLEQLVGPPASAAP
ncbi:MAG TPA: UPF0182 family protein [Candidatus Limnocylindrales bacterium]|nr:UPF0182 family protein [Candidatus Limnocylindrales bacterium]